MDRVVIVGASLAGWSLARSLRSAGFGGAIELIGDEPHRPYDRPPLSKAYLAGDLDLEGISLLVPDEDVPVTWRLGVPAVSLRERTVALADGTSVTGDAVVIATGTSPRNLPAAAGLRGVHTLRSCDDADALRAAFGPGARVVVIGAGFIGSEVASTASKLGAAVTVLDASPEPLAPVFGSEMASVVTSLHALHDVTLLTGVSVAGFSSSDGAVTGVSLADGRVLPADVVVVGIGVEPAVSWLAGSGVAVENGVVVDAAGRTSVPGVWACGDVARYPSARAGGAIRVEHWTHAREHGAAVASGLLGAPVEYDPVPYVWSEQYGVMLQFAGFVRPGDSVEIVDGDPASHRFVAAYRRSGRLVAVLGARIPRTFVRLRRELTAA
ncbi:NAD(P)/FAD-dependent oxidoreductase [Cryptosporangium aurantiacum]|uniref:NADPH-dependent 2,4-dienoyl-CoA reductase, sulfur reductase n=1 Tax=Cryptosporangium aurantiacum TaxID=134849 RepID=A0A1M7RHH4_9ACTN|nr:FAD-dependent oxidoreductase [Cryptosporangium aurantiacum]SHN45611.1 NADPH-dependent 2,4-dienoyl-CoA reductase, sulfur reductase [Cryptosporangium aurantiacum]